MTMAVKRNTKGDEHPLPRVMKMATEVRVGATKMSDEDRANCLRQGMQLIYGGKKGGAGTKVSGR